MNNLKRVSTRRQESHHGSPGLCQKHSLRRPPLSKDVRIITLNHWASLPHSDKESVCQCKRRGFDPWSSSYAWAPQLLSPWSRLWEPQLLKPVCLEPVLRSKRSHRRRSWWTARQSRPCSLQLEKSSRSNHHPAQPRIAKQEFHKHVNCLNPRVNKDIKTK